MGYPYTADRRHKRSQDECARYPYQNRTHIHYTGHTFVTVTSEADAELTIPASTVTTDTPAAGHEIVLVLNDTEKSLLKLKPQDSEDKVEKVQVVPDSQFTFTTTDSNISQPLVQLFHSSKTVSELYYDKRYAFYHIAYVSEPAKTVSVYEPHHDGTCNNGSYQLTNVLDSAKSRKCILAVNAGLFNTKTGACYGEYSSKQCFKVKKTTMILASVESSTHLNQLLT